MSGVAHLHRTLEQELLALARGASMACLVCGEFVMHRGADLYCPECGSTVRAEAGAAAGPRELDRHVG